MISEKLGRSIDRLLSELKLTRSTVKSRQEGGKKLPTLEAERKVRVAWLFKRAVDVFEDEEDARDWLKQSLRALGCKTPVSFFGYRSGLRLGRRRVEAHRIRHPALILVVDQAVRLGSSLSSFRISVLGLPALFSEPRSVESRSLCVTRWRKSHFLGSIDRDLWCPACR